MFTITNTISNKANASRKRHSPFVGTMSVSGLIDAAIAVVKQSIGANQVIVGKQPVKVAVDPNVIPRPTGTKVVSKPLHVELIDKVPQVTVKTSDVSVAKETGKLIVVSSDAHAPRKAVRHACKKPKTVSRRTPPSSLTQIEIKQRRKQRKADIRTARLLKQLDFSNEASLHEEETPVTEHRVILEVAVIEQPAAPEAEVIDTPRGRGRPVIERLCHMFEDSEVITKMKKVYKRIYNQAIEKAKQLSQFVVCFLCGLFRIVDYEDDYGRVAHYHRLLKHHFRQSVLPSLRALQTGVRWLEDKTKKFFRNLNEQAEEARHRKWEALVDTIYQHLLQLPPELSI